MSFSLSGSVIAQTGTDADGSGLASLAGVTTQTTGNFKTYFVGDVKIEIYGTFTLDPRKEKVVFGGNSVANSVHVKSGGVINLGLEVTENGESYYTPGSVLDIPSTILPGCCNNGAMTVDGGGTLNWYGASVLANACLLWSAGCIINIYDGTLVNNESNNVRIRSYCDNGTIDGFTIYGDVEVDFFRTFPSFKGYKPVGGSLKRNQAVSSGSGGSDAPYIFNDYNSEAVFTDWSIWANAEVNLVNVAKETPVSFTLDSGASGLIQGFKQFQLSVFDTSGNPVEGAKYIFSDVDNGGRANTIPRNGTDYDLTATRSYTGSSDANGDFPLATVLTYVSTATNVIDYRGKDNDWLSLFDVPIISYRYLMNTPTLVLTGAGVLIVTRTLVDDPQITQTDKSIVDAYTEGDTVNKFIDLAKAWTIDNNYVGTLATLSGDTAVTPYNVVVDPAVPEVFEFDGSTITVKASVFAGNLTATGSSTITTLSGATISGLISDVNGTTGLLEFN